MNRMIGNPRTRAMVVALLLLVVAPVGSARAQDVLPQWRHLTVDDGLAANDVWTILQDQDGALWFGTNGGGVSNFNGRWATYTRDNTEGRLAGDWVRSMLQARDGSIWVGTTEGLSRFDGERWERFGTEQGLPSVHVRALVQTDDDAIWAGTTGGLARYDGANWRSFTVQEGLVGNAITALWRDSEGMVWVGSDGGLNYCELRGRFSCLHIDELVGLPVNAILEDRSGMVWAASGSTVYQYDGSGWNALASAEGEPLPLVLCIAQDHEGFVWLGTEGDGALRFDGSQVVLRLTSADGLPAEVVRSISRDRDGALWFGTLGGVARYDERTWKGYLAGQTIMSMGTGPGGNLSVATAVGGLRFWVDGEWQSAPLEVDGAGEGLPTAWLEVLYGDTAGVLWIGTPGWGLVRYDGQSWRTYTTSDGLASDVVTAIYETADGTLWVGTDQGLSAYRDGEWRTDRSGSSSAMQGDVVLALAEDANGVLWVGTEAGVNRFSGVGWLEPFTPANSGLAAPEVRAILPRDDGSVWFGTWAGGVSQYDGRVWRTYTVADGLAANAVFSLIESSDGSVWIGTLSGVSRFDGRTWISYTALDGLVNSVARVVYQDAAGVVWIGTESGLSRYEPDPGIPSAHIVKVNGNRYKRGAIALLGGDSLVIDFDGGDLRTPRQDLVFTCYLEGLDAGWRLCDNYSQPALAHGQYMFHLQARDEDFNYSPEVSLPVTVRRGLAVPWLGGRLVLPMAVVALIAGVVVLAVVALSVYLAPGFGRPRSRRLAFQRRFNPYISGEPIRREDMFFGRDSLISQIMTILHNNSIMIHGERRIGKTTLLYQLANRLRAGTDPVYWFVPVMVDLEGTSMDTFFHTMMDDIVRTCGTVVELPVLVFQPRYDQEYTDRDFSRDLAAILEALKATTTKEARVILLIDEMDVIDTFGSMTQLQLRRIFMTTFAHNLGAVVAGVQISKKWDRPESPWFNLFHEVAVAPFTDEEARQLITEPVRGVYRFAEKAIQRIIVYGKGRPYRIQQYCLESVNQMLAQERSKVTLKDVEAAHRIIQ